MWKGRKGRFGWLASHISVGDTSHRLFKHGLKTGLSPKRLMRSGCYKCTTEVSSSTARRRVSHRNTHTHIHTNAHAGRISCRHHKPTASLIEFSFPITSSDDLITFSFDATHKNKRTQDGISLFSVCLSLSVSPSSVIADNLVVAFKMAGHYSEVYFPELSYSLRSAQFTEKALWRRVWICWGCAEYG